MISGPDARVGRMNLFPKVLAIYTFPDNEVKYFYYGPVIYI